MKGKVITLLLVVIVSFFYIVNIKSAEGIEKEKEVEIIFENYTELKDSVSEINVFGDNSDELYLDLISFLDSNNYSYSEHLISSPDFLKELDSYKKEFARSQGMSKNFRYYPIIFIKDVAFSGFNKEIGEKIKKIIEEDNIWEDTKKEEDLL
ncbi:MAG: hypothetical protein PHG24_02060 [Candidatus Pacebacteria bacterium]|nr:hypothetical protein [Candidatus Paceibacterota bacterium]